ncbi:MAG: hypothetical protein R3C05_09420 [Pirellulaceae bacterium]
MSEGLLVDELFFVIVETTRIDVTVDWTSQWVAIAGQFGNSSVAEMEKS